MNDRRDAPTITRYMTPSPRTIERTQPLSTARQRMEQLDVQHLPVLEAGHLIGVLSGRELRLLASLPGVDLDTLEVGDAMRPDPLCVTPDVPLTAVLSEMTAHRHDCAIVVRHGQVIGIFTTTDALQVLWSMVPHSRAREPSISSPGDARLVGR